LIIVFIKIPQIGQFELNNNLFSGNDIAGRAFLQVLFEILINNTVSFAVDMVFQLIVQC